MPLGDYRSAVSSSSCRLVRGQIGKARGGTCRCVETDRLRQPHQVEKPPNYGMV